MGLLGLQVWSLRSLIAALVAAYLSTVFAAHDNSSNERRTDSRSGTRTNMKYVFDLKPTMAQTRPNQIGEL